jgi:hypothetical protein
MVAVYSAQSNIKIIALLKAKAAKAFAALKILFLQLITKQNEAFIFFVPGNYIF